MVYVIVKVSLENRFGLHHGGQKPKEYQLHQLLSDQNHAIDFAQHLLQNLSNVKSFKLSVNQIKNLCAFAAKGNQKVYLMAGLKLGKNKDVQSQWESHKPVNLWIDRKEGGGKFEFYVYEVSSMIMASPLTVQESFEVYKHYYQNAKQYEWICFANNQKDQESALFPRSPRSPRVTTNQSQGESRKETGEQKLKRQLSQRDRRGQEQRRRREQQEKMRRQQKQRVRGKTPFQSQQKTPFRPKQQTRKTRAAFASFFPGEASGISGSKFIATNDYWERQFNLHDPADFITRMTKRCKVVFEGADTANKNAVRKLYLRKSKLLHPDKNPDAKEAWEALAACKLFYDNMIDSPPTKLSNVTRNPTNLAEAFAMFRK